MSQSKTIRVEPRGDAYVENKHWVVVDHADEKEAWDILSALAHELVQHNEPTGYGRRAVNRGTHIEVNREPTEDDLATIRKIGTERDCELSITIRTDQEWQNEFRPPDESRR